MEAVELTEDKECDTKKLAESEIGKEGLVAAGTVEVDAVDAVGTLAVLVVRVVSFRVGDLGVGVVGRADGWVGV